MSVALMFGVGSRHEPGRIAGASHFIEHMLFKGSRRYPTSRDIAEAIESVGGVLNAETDKELTMYWAKVPGDRLGLAIDMLVDATRNPLLDPTELEKEREVIIEEIRMYVDSPGDHVHTLFEEQLWPGHPLGIDIAGTEESLRATAADDLSGYMADHYLAGNLVVTLAGNVDHAEAAGMVREAVAGWPAAEPPAFLPTSPPPATVGIRMLSKDTEQAHIVLGTRCTSYNHPDRFVLELLDGILGGGMSSRLFQEIREKLGLCYDVHSWVATLSDTGSAGVYIGTEPRRAQEAIKAVMHELHRLCEEPVAERELNKAREYHKGRLLLGLEGTNSMATWLGGQELLTGRILEVSEIVEVVDAITVEDLLRVARETFAEQPIQVAAIGPFKREEDLLDLVKW